MAGKSESTVAVSGSEGPAIQTPRMAEVVDVSEAVFEQALETYVECRTARDTAEARMKASVPAIATYVIANGVHEKPDHPDDAKMEHNGYRVAWLWANHFTPEPGVEWTKGKLVALDEERKTIREAGESTEALDAQVAQIEALLVPTVALNRALWESLADAPRSPIPAGVADCVRGGGYKPDIRMLSHKECACGAKVHKSFKFCPMCGGDVQALFAAAHKRKKG